MVFKDIMKNDKPWKAGGGILDTWDGPNPGLRPRDGGDPRANFARGSGGSGGR